MLHMFFSLKAYPPCTIISYCMIVCKSYVPTNPLSLTYNMSYIPWQTRLLHTDTPHALYTLINKGSVILIYNWLLPKWFWDLPLQDLNTMSSQFPYHITNYKPLSYNRHIIRVHHLYLVISGLQCHLWTIIYIWHNLTSDRWAFLARCV